MKKTTRIFGILLIAVMLLGLLAMTASASAAEEGYSGTPVTPTKINSTNYHLYGFTADNWKAYNGYYAITNAEELYGWRETLGNAVLINDIVVNTGNMVAAGDAGTPPAHLWTAIDQFSDVLDGRGHSISGLYIVEGSDGRYKYTGLFEYLRGTVKNLTISNTYVRGTSAYNGVIAATQWTADGIINVKIDSNVKCYTESNFGALMGDVNDAKVVFTNCVSLANIQINSARYVGALVGGGAEEAVFTNCYYTYTGRAGVGDNLSSYNMSGMSRVSVANHTCIAMEHPAVVASCYAKGSTAYSDCMICGKILSGTKSVTDYSHNNFSYTAHATDTEKHVAACTDCGETFDQAHSFDSNNTCVCGAQATAMVAGQRYVAIDTAFAQANATNGATLKLLTNVTLSKVEMKGTFTLDLNGFTLNSADNYQYSLYVTAGHLTIQDSVGTGAILTNAKDSFIGVYNSASFTVTGGTFGEVIANVSGAVTVTGGKFTELNISGNGTKSISGGEFGTLWCTSTPLENCLVEDYYIYNASGELVDTRAIRKIENVTVRKGADLKYAEIILEYTETAYTALEKRPTVALTINGRAVAASNYDVAYSNNMTVGTEATVTVTGKGSYSGSNSTTFEITKGSLQVVTNPETTYEFGATYTDVVTGGKVVIVGNEPAVITGTWTWVEAGNTAIFTPDAQYEGLFEELTNVSVTHVVTAATPVIELVTPSPAMGPGQRIRMSVVVKNPHNGELTDLPTAFRLTYKIGENGTPVTVDGLEFTLPADTLLGEKVYVTVENVAVSGKYAGATSVNIIELAVGQVDYTAAINALEEQIAQLKAEHNADVSVLEAELEALKAAVAALNDTYATDEELAAAVQTINNTISELTNRITTLENTYATKTALEEAIKALNEAIAAGDAAGTKALEEAVAALEKALENAVAALEKAYKDADTALKTELEALIADTKTALETAIAALEARMTAAEGNITQLQADLAAAIAELETAIATNSGDIDALEAAVAALEQALSDAIDELKGLISAAETAAKAYADEQDAALRTALETMINEAKATLEAAIAALDARVTQNEADIAALQAALTKAIEDLNKAIAEGDAANTKALEEAVAQLTRLLNEAVDKLEQADDKNKAALENMINQAKAALEEAIAQLRADLEQAVEDLENADKANADALTQAVIDLTALIEAVEKAAAVEDAAIRSELAAAKASLQSAIVTLRNELYSIRSELVTLMTDKDAVLDGKIADLAATLEAAVAALEAADEAVKAELTAAIDAAKSALTAAIEQVAADLAATRLLLNTSMAAGDKALHNRINELTAALEAAIAAAEAADADLSAELEAAVATLNAAIDQMQQALNQAKTELTAKDAALDAKDAQLQQLVTVAIVIASVGVAGCVALVIYITVDKRKKV